MAAYVISVLALVDDDANPCRGDGGDKVNICDIKDNLDERTILAWQK